MSELSAAGVEYIVVGAFAVGAHGNPRATGDIDIWVRPTRENAARVLQALRAFGAPLYGLSIDDLVDEQTVFQIGVAPVRIDILAGIDGVGFDDAWSRRMIAELGPVSAPVLSLVIWRPTSVWPDDPRTSRTSSGLSASSRSLVDDEPAAVVSSSDRA